MNLLHTLRRAFADALAQIFPEGSRYSDLVKPAQDARFGDYQANCAMPLAKQLKRNPRDVAGEIITRLQLGAMASAPEIAGPGFINLRLDSDWLCAAVRRLSADDRLGVEQVSSPQTIVIDFSSPNVAKPMHVGHIRSTIIGDALTRLLRFLGHRVITDNHIGDWGTQFGMLIFGYKYLLDEAAYASQPVTELARLYRFVNALSEGADVAGRLRVLPADAPEREELVARGSAFEAQVRELRATNPKVEQLASRFPDVTALSQYVANEARQETARLHAGDSENRKLWQSFMPHCLADLDRVYDRLDIHFDHHFGESFYDPMLSDVVKDLLARSIAEESDGAICVFLDPDHKQPPCLIRKRDGAFLYATSDLATIKHRVDQFQPGLILYVVGQPQSLHFQQLFEVARRWGYTAVEFVHVGFGTILGSDGRPFRTRAGGTVGLEPLLDEAVERAGRAYSESRQDRVGKGMEVPELSPKEFDDLVEAVGIGAIKYADLAVNRTSDYTFNWDKMMAMQGNTATYLQYAYARIQSIFRRGQVQVASLRQDPPAVALSEPAERTLAMMLLRFPETLDEAALDFKPSVIAGYLFELAENFSSFYTNCPVLQADTPALRASRLLLCDLTARTLRRGLELLGIRTIDQM
jgi:arginyl-tRNA synthetase